jgi:hypothetical protein
MAVTCPQCGAEFDVTLFTFGRRIRCDCGAWVDLAVGHQRPSERGTQLVQHATPHSTEQQHITSEGVTTMSTQITEWLEAVAKVLLRCWLFGFLLLLMWFGLFMLAPNVIFGLHGGMFGLSPHELNIIHYSGMAFLKLMVICFFFFPWAAIKLVLRKHAV